MAYLAAGGARDFSLHTVHLGARYPGFLGNFFGLILSFSVAFNVLKATKYDKKHDSPFILYWGFTNLLYSTTKPSEAESEVQGRFPSRTKNRVFCHDMGTRKDQGLHSIF